MDYTGLVKRSWNMMWRSGGIWGFVLSARPPMPSGAPPVPSAPPPPSAPPSTPTGSWPGDSQSSDPGEDPWAKAHEIPPLDGSPEQPPDV